MKTLNNIDRHRYKGWTITYSDRAPVTGRWMAAKYGIRMCNTTEDGLKRMIDVNVHDKWHATAHLPN